MKVVDSVNPASIIHFLFQEAVIGADDMRALLRFRDDPQQQCSELLALLHTSGNRQAFVHLYLAVKKEKCYQWLVEDIDKFTDQSLIDLLQQLYISEPTGKCVFLLYPTWYTVHLILQQYFNSTKTCTRDKTWSHTRLGLLVCAFMGLAA